ncbi:MAG: hypothetical protein IK093_08445, partial [Ruminiclostridium sp.]|nr:hypothetical protein [Ruminiclostridium sp.]
MGLFKKKNNDIPSPAEEKKERDETAEIRREIEHFISKMDEINFDKIYKKTNFAVIPESELTTVYFPRIAKLREEAHNLSASTVESLGTRDIIDNMIKLAEILNIALAASYKRPADISIVGIKYC